jgi:hypothetical protein
MKVISIHNFISSSGSGSVINYGSGSDFLTSYGSGSTTLVVTSNSTVLLRIWNPDQAHPWIRSKP